LEVAMRWLSLLFALSMACAPASTSEGEAPDTEAEAEPEPYTSDEAIARAMIEGSFDLGQGIRSISGRGGFPVRTTSGRFLFLAHPALCSQNPCALVGDHGGWVPEMFVDDGAIPWLEIDISEPAGSGYKLLVDPGAGERYVEDPLARSSTYDAFGALSYVRPPVDAPRLDRWLDLGGPDIPARTVLAFVPPGDGPWPTLYMQDGQNLFDPGATFGSWRLLDVLPALAGPVLVVGIPSGPNRLSEYAHVDDTLRETTVQGRGDAYATFVAEVVRPTIEVAYGEPPHVGLLGSSMGGLASLSIAHAQPGRWDFAGSMSGTLGWGRFGAEGPTLQEIYVADPRPELVVYADSGGGPGPLGCRDLNGDGSFADDPDHTDNYCTNRAFVDALAATGQRWNETLFHWHEPGAPHNEAAWRARVHRPLEIFLGLGR